MMQQHNNILIRQQKIFMIQSLKQFALLVDPTSNVAAMQTAASLITLLGTIHESLPKKFANKITTLIEGAQNYINECNNKQKCDLINIILLSIQIYPAILKKKPNIIEKLFDLICRIMANISSDFPNAWYNPSIDDADCKISMQIYDPDAALIQNLREPFQKLVIYAGQGKVMKIMQNKAYTYYKDGDWRWKCAVLTCFSQIATQNLAMNKLDNIINLFKISVNDSHPKVRFASIQFLVRFIDPKLSDFQNTYFQQFMPIIMNGLNDPVQRVAAHWFIGLDSFIFNYPRGNQILPYFDHIIQKICQFIEKGNKTSKQSALQALTSFSSINQLFTPQTIKKPFEICHSILQAFPAQEYKHLINKTFECLSITIQGQPLQLVKDYIAFTIGLIDQIGKNLDGNYLVECWRRICLAGYKFQNWKSAYIQVFEAFKQLELVDKQQNYKAISETAKTFKQQFIPYAVESIKYISNDIQIAMDALKFDAAANAFQAIQNISKYARPSNPDAEWDKNIKQRIQDIIEKINIIIDGDIFDIEKMLTSIKNMLQEYGNIFTQEELVNLLTKFQDLANQLQTKKFEKNNNQEMDDEQDLDEQTEQTIQQDIKNINESKLILPDIFGFINKNVSDPSLLIQKQLEHIKLSITKATDDQDFEYAIAFLNNILVDFQYEYLKDYWTHIYNFLSQYFTNTSLRLRHLAVYGFGFLAMKTPPQFVNKDTINSWVVLTKSAFKLPKLETQSPKEYSSCRENCMAAIGRIVYKFGKHLNIGYLLDDWLTFLPFKYDMMQGKVQIRYLCQIIQKQSQIYINSSNKQKSIQRIKKLMKVFAYFSYAAATKEHLKHIEPVVASRLTVRKIINDPIFKENQKEIMQGLNEKQRFSLGKLLQVE